MKKKKEKNTLEVIEIPKRFGREEKI